MMSPRWFLIPLALGLAAMSLGLAWAKEGRPIDVVMDQQVAPPIHATADSEDGQRQWSWVIENHETQAIQVRATLTTNLSLVFGTGGGGAATSSSIQVGPDWAGVNFTISAGRGSSYHRYLLWSDDIVPPAGSVDVKVTSTISLLPNPDAKPFLITQDLMRLVVVQRPVADPAGAAAWGGGIVAGASIVAGVGVAFARYGRLEPMW